MLTPDWHPDDARLRQFALGCLLAAALLGYAAHETTDSTHLLYGLAAVGVSFFVVGRLKPSLLQPAYYVLLIVAQPVGWLVSHLILGLFFYGVLTPLGLFFRVIGRDALSLSRPATASYWSKREKEKGLDSYFRQA